MRVNFKIESTNREYSLDYLDIHQITQLALNMSQNNFKDDLTINTGRELIKHSYDEIQELAKTALELYVEELKKVGDMLNKQGLSTEEAIDNALKNTRNR